VSWSYTKRADRKIAVTLDNNVWNFLFERKINLADELPPDQFALFITREVEIEAAAIPDTEAKGPLKEYISEIIRLCGITTTSVFGFATPGPGPQRVGGWGQGTWQSQTEREFYDAIRNRFLMGKREKGSQLTENEGDAAVAAQSFFSVVLTCEKPTTVGPLRFAAENGGKVLYLPDFNRNGMSLREYVVSLHDTE
jgi:hypothetical protein